MGVESQSLCVACLVVLFECKASTVSVEVKKSQHKYVIGPKGNSINEIFAETGVFVEMPSRESVSETITLRGPQDKLGLGKLRKVFFVCVYLDSTRLFLLKFYYLNKLFLVLKFEYVLLILNMMTKIFLEP